MFREKLVKVDDYQYILPKTARKEMNVDGKIIANSAIINDIDDSTIQQLSNVASLPGVAEPVVALPDVHFGYGLPMGAVAAFHPENGVISAGLCGFDINCGVNSIRTDLEYKDIKPKIKEIIAKLFDAIPSGVGSKGRLKLSYNQLDDVLVNGVDWAVENGYGIKKDTEHMEENGRMGNADPSKVSDLAKKRGLKQLGTLGAGNHFLEIQHIDKVYDKETAKRWGLFEGQVMVMIHTGSRGLGHQIATDYLRIHEAAAKKYRIWLPDKQLASAPISSKEGQDYFSAMKAAVNYSFTNKLIMTHWLREVFEKAFKQDWESLGMHTVYSIAHNIVKKEKINNKELYIHRKGATRSYPGLPVLIAGSMGTSSYIAKGTEKALELTFGSSCHGAGRALSRHQAIKSFNGREIKRELLSKGIVAQSANAQSLAEEAPGAYKNVDDVINTIDSLGISKKVVRLRPLGVIKG